MKFSVSCIKEAIADAAQQGAQLVVFPETFIPYYPYFSFVLPPVLMGKEHLRLYKEAVEVPSPVTEAVSQAAKERSIVVVLGVNERDRGTLYNAQLIFDADGELRLKRRKISPTYHERLVWGQGDGLGLKVLDTAVGKLGALACWEHYNPLARYSLMAQHEQNSLRAVSRLNGGSNFCRANRSDNPPSCLRIRLLCGQCYRMAYPRTARPNRSR